MRTATPFDRQAAQAPDIEARRILWRCRRGMKELDVVLERFVQGTLSGASPLERAALERLLALPDPLLAGYLLGGDCPQEPEMAHLTARIRDYV